MHHATFSSHWMINAANSPSGWHDHGVKNVEHDYLNFFFNIGLQAQPALRMPVAAVVKLCWAWSIQE